MTKIRFKPEELRAIHNSRFFYTKALATQKIDSLLAEARDEIKSVIKEKKLHFPKEVDIETGKIFRGENYLSLPYLVLDYPKYFSKDSVFAFRTMFWWGNFFSCTLHLQGKELEKYRPAMLNLLPQLRKEKGIYICVNREPWQYHYQKDNYVLLSRLPGGKSDSAIQNHNFIKLSRKMELKNYRKLPEFARDSFDLLLPIA